MSNVPCPVSSVQCPVGQYSKNETLINETVWARIKDLRPRCSNTARCMKPLVDGRGLTVQGLLRHSGEERVGWVVRSEVPGLLRLDLAGAGRIRDCLRVNRLSRLMPWSVPTDSLDVIVPADTRVPRRVDSLGSLAPLQFVDRNEDPLISVWG